MSKIISQILEPGEKIIWEGNISRTLVGFQIFSIIVILTFLVIFFRSLTQSLLLVIIAFSALYFAYKLIQKFVLTDKRLIIKTGLIGADFRSIYFTEVRSADVRVDLIDKMFNIGTIRINIGLVASSGMTNKSMATAYIVLPHLDNPYFVYQKFQETLNEYKERLYSGKNKK